MSQTYTLMVLLYSAGTSHITTDLFQNYNPRCIRIPEHGDVANEQICLNRRQAVVLQTDYAHLTIVLTPCLQYRQRMKDSANSLTSKFYLYQSEKENRQGENTKRPLPSANCRRSIDNLQYSSSQSTYINKLQFKYQQLIKLFQSSQAQLKSLQDENNCLRKICQKQQQKLSQNKNADMIREEFNKQIEEMSRQKEKVAELLASITQQHSREMVQLTTYSKSIEGTLQQNRKQRKKSEELFNQKLAESEGMIEALRAELYEKRNIEKKYRLVLRDLNRMERSLSRPKQK